MAEVESGGGRTVRMSPDELPDPGTPSVPSSLPDLGEPPVPESPDPNATQLGEPGVAADGLPPFEGEGLALPLDDGDGARHDVGHRGGKGGDEREGGEGRQKQTAHNGSFRVR